MKPSLITQSAMFFVAVAGLPAATLYVTPDSSNPTPPYSTWETAAREIPDALGSAEAGDEIVVTNGTYATGGVFLETTNTVMTRVVVPPKVILRSINGPQFTTIEGGQEPPVRCVYLHDEAQLCGFTVSNGAALVHITPTNWKDRTGAGVLSESLSAAVSNCVITANRAFEGGGAAFVTLKSCLVCSNTAVKAAGAEASTLIGCTIVGNRTMTLGQWDGTGGGVATSRLTNCVVANNSSAEAAGGADSCTLVNCIVTNNRAVLGGGAVLSALYNCTVAGNSATDRAGGLFSCGATNCIVYSNAAPASPNYNADTFSRVLSYCCTTPMPTNGVGNITNAPLWVDYDGRGLALQSNSPCINAGHNLYVGSATDLAGNPRIVGGTVDLGAYEFRSPQSIISYAWLQQYGLPTDGSMDFADTDRDGMNNWQEWRAWTDPIDAHSALRMLRAVAGAAGVAVSWQSIDGKSYLLERSTNLAAQPAFETVVPDLTGAADTTFYLDTNATGRGPFFYRVGVQ